MHASLRTTLLVALTLAARPVGAQRPEPAAVRVSGSGSRPDSWVLLSSMVGGVAGFRQVESRLVAEGYRVVVIDPYHLSLHSTDVTLDAMARRVASVLTRLDVRCVHLVGHGYGGGVALRVAALLPAAVTSVHLLDAGAIASQQGDGLALALRFVPIITRLPGGRAFVRRRLVDGVRDNSARDDWLTVDVQRMYTDPFLDRIGEVVAMAVRMGRSTEPEPVAAVLGRVHAPVQVLLGGVQTRAGPDASAVAALRALPTPAVLERLEGAGHFLHEEMPDAVVRALLRHASARTRLSRAP